MGTQIPDTYQDLLKTETKAFAQLATLFSDGSPQVTPVWFDYTGGKIRVNSAKGRAKDKNMRKNPHVAVAINDPANPYRHIAIRGKVVNITETGADEHIDSLAMKYLGQPKYPMRRPGEVRVTYEIEITSATTMG